MLQKIKVAISDPSIVLRNPKNMQKITTEGDWVEKNAFWIRRINAGDVVVLETKQPSET